MFESLETRRMLSISVVGARITVTGTPEPDVITIEQYGAPNKFLVFENGTTTVVESNRIVKQIVLNGVGDDDYLVVNQNISAAATLDGGDANDTLVGGGGADKFVGGDGTDTADFSSRGENLRLSLNGVADDGAFGEGDNIQTDVEDIWGGGGNDVIVGNTSGNTDVANFFSGGAGDDDIRGLGGDDLIFGGIGADSLDGGAGNDVIAGNEGSDYILGGDGDDLVEANDGELDTVIGGAGSDTVWADSGNPVVDNVNAEEVFLI